MKKVLKQATDHYLKLRDFNGFPVRNLDYSIEEKKEALKKMVSDGLISVNFGDIHQNPYIQAFSPEPTEEQLKKLEKSTELEQVCIYPTKKHLTKIVKKSEYLGKPFELMMALGEPQLSFKPFDLSVLENYRNDPRYKFDCDDIHGSLSIGSDFSEKDKVYKRDDIYLQSFGFAYTKKLTKRAVAVYLRYLVNLTPEHQQFWFNKMLKGKYFIHPDYHKASMGSWEFNGSIFNAFIEEIHHINAMVNLMGKPKLFKQEYTRESKPRNFSFLLRPTLKEFNEFTLLLDKLMSDNLNKKYFKGDIELDREESMKDGRVKVNPKGTIQLLEEWLRRVTFPDPDPKIDMINIFKKVRKLRQSPAHSVNEDVFDQKYIKKQRELMIEAYGAVRTLRLIFANHPRAKGYKKVPEWIYKGKISTY